MSKYICKICGYIHTGDEPPMICPLCNVGREQFTKVDHEQRDESNNIEENDFDFREYIVTDKIKENEVVTSFYLRRKDEKKHKPHKAGQYLSIRPISEGENKDETRQYSLSMKPGIDNMYRISVKREENGFISKYMHDNVKVGDMIRATNPMGQMILKDTNKPLILISGGIGVTPMMSMMYQGIRDRDIMFIQACTNSSQHTFKNELDFVKSQNHNLNKIIFYSRPLETDVEGKDYNNKGYITNEWLKENLPKNGDYYFCGPIKFMKNIYDTLIEMGVEKDYINYEMFGPSKDLATLEI